MSRTNRERKFQGANVPGSEYSWVRKFQGTKVSGPFRSGERKFQGVRRPRSERARERMDQGTKVPGSELARVLLADSLPGANRPGSEKTVNRTFCRFFVRKLLIFPSPCFTFSFVFFHVYYCFFVLAASILFRLFSCCFSLFYPKIFLVEINVDVQKFQFVGVCVWCQLVQLLAGVRSGIWLKYAGCKSSSCVRGCEHTQASWILGLWHSRYRMGVGTVALLSAVCWYMLFIECNYI